MNERQKTVLMWLIAVLALFLGVWVCCGAHRQRLDWQGAGAGDLLAKEPTVKNGSKFFTQPLIPVQTIAPIFLPILYMAATATDQAGLESDYSNEALYQLSKPVPRRITLAWDRSPGTNIIINYQVYRGLSPLVYTRQFNAGTNLTLSIPIGRTETNLVVTVTTINGTELVRSDSRSGPWTRMYTTFWVATNPPGTRFFRALGAGSRVEIKTEWF